MVHLGVWEDLGLREIPLRMVHGAFLRCRHICDYRYRYSIESSRYVMDSCRPAYGLPLSFNVAPSILLA